MPPASLLVASAAATQLHADVRLLPHDERWQMSDVKTTLLPSGERLHTIESAEDGRPDVAGFAEVIERLLRDHPNEPYLAMTGYLKRELCEQLVFLLGAPKGRTQ